MPASKTHNSIVLRPPPGTRFTIFGSDVHLEFQRGKEKEVHRWLSDWIDNYILPEAYAHDKRVAAQAKAALVEQPPAKPVSASMNVRFPFLNQNRPTQAATESEEKNGKSEE